MKTTKNIFFIALLLFVVQITSAQISCSEQISVEWLKSFGDSGNEMIKDIDCDNNNNIIIAGFTTAQFSIGGQDINFPSSDYAFFIAKFDPQGNIIWLKHANTVNNHDSCNIKIAIDSYNNIFILGDFYSTLTIETTTLSTSGTNDADIFLFKLSDSGNLIFAQKYGSQGMNIAGGISIDNSDNVVFNGYFETAMTINGTPLFPYGQGDNFIIKLSNSGSYLWAKDYGSTYFDIGTNLVCDGSGNIYSIGKFQGTIFAGSYQLITSTMAMYLFKLNSAGNVVYAIKNEIDANSDINVVSVDALQNVYIAYKQNITNDLLIQQYNISGILSMTKNYGNSCINITDIITDKHNYFYITGYLCPVSSVDFGDGDIQNSSLANNIFIVKYSSSGLFVDKKIQTLSSNSTIATSISVQNGKDVIVGGYNSGTFSIDGKSITSFSGALFDAFFMKISDYLYVNNISQSSVGCNLNNMSVNLNIVGNNAPFTYLWSTGATTQNLSEVPLATYYVTITDNSNCTVTDSIVLTPPTGVPINLPTNITMCFYDTIPIDAGNNYTSYLWSTGANTQSISVSQVGSYSLTVTDFDGCSSTTTIQVNKSPNINIFFNTTYHYCKESIVDIFAGYFQSYLWSNGSNAPNIQVGTSSEINIRVFDGNCYYFDTIQVEQYPDMIVDLGPDRIICVGDSTLLQTTTPFSTYFWSNGSSAPNCYASQQGYYFVQVSNNNGCYGNDSIYIGTTAKPSANLGADTILCVNNYILDPKNPLLYNSYLWSTGESSNTININSSGTYWVQISASNNACVVRDTINVQIYPSFTVDIGEDRNICPGQSVTFAVDTSSTTILWMNGSSDAYINVSIPQTVSVVITNNLGCVAKDTAEVFVSYVEFPNLGSDTILCMGTIYELTFDEEEAQAFLWSTGSTMRSISITQAGNYSVTITNAYGCTNSDDINISYEDSPIFSNINTNYGRIEITATSGQYPYYYSLDNNNWQSENIFYNCEEGFHTVFIKDVYSCMSDTLVEVAPVYKIPSFFTPNNDGFNDIWEIYGFHLFPNGVASIYDRYGKLLFVFKGVERGWGGQYAGQPVPADTYWYIVDFKNGNIAKGSVTIIR